MQTSSQLIGLFVLFAAAAAAMYFSQRLMMALDRNAAALKAARAVQMDEAERTAALIERIEGERTDI